METQTKSLRIKLNRSPKGKRPTNFMKSYFLLQAPIGKSISICITFPKSMPKANLPISILPLHKPFEKLSSLTDQGPL